MPLVRANEPWDDARRRHVPPVREIQGSTLVASRAALRRRGLFDDYVARLAPQARPRLDAITPGEWVPIAAMREHFAACEALAMPASEVVAIGRELMERLHHPVLAVGLRMAGAIGATPVTMGALGIKMWPRRNHGGDLLIRELGSRDARVELLGYPLADLAHVRHVWRGVIGAMAELFARSALVVEQPERCDATTIAFRLSWT